MSGFIWVAELQGTLVAGYIATFNITMFLLAGKQVERAVGKATSTQCLGSFICSPTVQPFF